MFSFRMSAGGWRKKNLLSPWGRFKETKKCLPTLGKKIQSFSRKAIFFQQLQTFWSAYAREVSNESYAVNSFRQPDSATVGSDASFLLLAFVRQLRWKRKVVPFSPLTPTA